jgi:hypothetical protein
MAYYKLEPFGSDRDNWHAANIASMLYNINRKKGSKATTAADFMFIDQGTIQQNKADSFTAELRRRVKRKK